MNINDLNFPEGIKLNLVFGETLKERKGRKLSTSLGISKERYNTLKEQVTADIIKSLGGKSSFLELDKLVEKIAAKCQTIPELTFTMYALGVILEQKKMQQQKEKGRGKGGLLSSLGGIIIAMGGAGLPKGEMGDNGEDPSVEELIRRSKKINGDYNSPKSGSGEDDFE